jgi:nitrogen-specific signal transduction histidine kinase
MDQGAISPNLKANRIALGQILLKARWKRVAVMAKTASSSKSKASEKFSAAERQAMKDRAQELKNKAKGLKGEAELMEKVKLMNKEDNPQTDHFNRSRARAKDLVWNACLLQERQSVGLFPKCWQVEVSLFNSWL